jgi:F5/8 type C domain
MSPVAAYNVAFLLTFPLSALAAHALAFSLAGRHDAAAVGAVLFGFSPFRMAHFPHIQMLAAFWMPIALLGLHGYVRTKDPRWLWLFGISWLMQALSNGYYLLFFPVLLALWVAWFVPMRSQARSLAGIAAAWLIASLPLVPLLWGYREIHSAFHLQRGIGDAEFFGADIASFLNATPLLKFSKLAVFDKPEGELFPGIIAPALITIVVIRWLAIAKKETDRRPPRFSYVLLFLALVFISVAVSGLFIGPWSLKVGGVTVVSFRLASKPISLAVLFVLSAALIHPRFVALWKSRSLLGFYVFATMVMYLLSFGPSPRLFGMPFLYKAPYAWLTPLPGFHSIRVPARFAMLGVLCLATSASLAFARLTSRMPRGRVALVASVVIALGLAEGWVGQMPLASLPPRLATIETLARPSAVAELPLGDVLVDTAALYRSMYHHVPVVNGYSGFFPAYYNILRLGFDGGQAEDEVFDGITHAGPVVFVIDLRHSSADRWTQLLARRKGATQLGVESGKRLLWVPPNDEADPGIDREPIGSRVSIHAITANVSGPMTVLMTDGNPETRWTTDAAQDGTEVVTIDLGVVNRVTGVSMGLGPYVTDFPRVLEIDRSEDGQSWTTSWKGPTTARAMVAAMRSPRDVPLVVSFAPGAARFVRLRQLGHDPKFFWSITELEVYGR